jgi:hypothetical protein
MSFKIGDRVVSYAESCEELEDCLPVGVCGTVRYVSDRRIGVEWDVSLPRLHSLGGKANCKEGYGWFVDYKNLKLVEEK